MEGEQAAEMGQTAGGLEPECEHLVGSQPEKW